MAKIQEKERAQKLRVLGYSIGDIAKQLAVSKSTVSLWCRDIQLSAAAKTRIAQKGNSKATVGLLAYSETKRQVRQARTKANTNRGIQRTGTLTERDLWCIGLGLYWGEGYKRGNREFGFTNSEPDMIQFYIHWLRAVFAVPKDQLILRVSINQQHQHRINAVEAYWSTLTRIPRTQFTKASLIKTTAKKQYNNTEKHFGTLRIKVRKGNKWREEVLGAIAHAAAQAA